MSHGSTVEAAEAMVRAGLAPRAVGRRRRRWLLPAILLAAAALLALVLYPLVRGLFTAAPDTGTLHVVQRGPLSITLQEDGELKPVDSVDIKCEVQGQNVTIQWIVPESTAVKKGDLLVRLAAEDIRERVLSEELELRTARGAVEEAEQALLITESENASKLRKAEIDREIAALDLRKYNEGDYPKALTTIDLNIQQTELDIKQKEEELRKSRELLAQEFISRFRIEELELALQKSQMTLEMYKSERAVLESIEQLKNVKQKESTLQQAIEELEREAKRGNSRLQQARLKVNTLGDALRNREMRLNRLKDQLAKAEIHAPTDGIVQYGEGGGMFRWGGNRIAVGERVFDGQTLITLPDTRRMKVSTRIHEADRHRIREGLVCLVRVPAVPGRTFTGSVSKITQFADSERTWWNPDLKEHETEILLDGNDAALSPGDSAQVEILIEEVPDVLSVPVQSVFARGPRRFVFVRRRTGAEPAEIEVGRSSSTLIEVTRGLSPGDRVLMAADEQLLALLPVPAAGTEFADQRASRPASQPAASQAAIATAPPAGAATRPSDAAEAVPASQPGGDVHAAAVESQPAAVQEGGAASQPAAQAEAPAPRPG